MNGKKATKEDAPYATKIRDKIEAYLMKSRKGKFSTKDHQSQSIAAACECAAILRAVVTLYHEAETLPRSRSVRSLRAGTPASEVATQQVSTLIRHVTRAGMAMQRGPFFKLLITNVTRRVLSIIREAAADNCASDRELESLAVEFLNSFGEEELSDEETSSNSQHEAAAGTLSGSPHGTSAEGAASRNFAPPPADLGTGSDIEEATSDEASGAASDDDDDVELEGLQSKPKTAPAASPFGGLKRSTMMLADSDDAAQAGQAAPRVRFADPAPVAASQPIAVGQSSKQRETSRMSGAPEPSSLLSELLSHTPPKNLLARAPSILGEVDIAHVKEYPVRFDEFAAHAIEGISMFEDELKRVTLELGKSASRQLHEMDTVITLGGSHSTNSFLLRAADDRRSAGLFKVIVLEGSPLRGSHRLADALRERGIDVRVLPDSSAFAVMPTCTKVVIGVENVLANGGLLAPIGTHPLCIAAKHFAVPVMVVTMTLKMTPYYPSDALCTSLVKISRSQAEETPWSMFASPAEVLPLHLWPHMDADFMQDLDVVNPLMEYVPPELVTLFATNQGEYTVPQIHRIVRDNYNTEDSHL